MEVKRPSVYRPAGDFLVSRKGDAVELLACRVIELETDSVVGVIRDLTPAEARELGQALLAAANDLQASNAPTFL